MNPIVFIPPHPPTGWFRPAGGGAAPDSDALLAHLPDIVVRFDRDLRHVFVNAAMERVSGRPGEEFLGKTPGEVNNPGDLSDRLEANLRQVFDTGEERFFDHTDNQNARCFAIHLVPEFAPDPEGTGGPAPVEFVLVISHDVTARQGAIEALRQSETRYRDLFDQATDLVHRSAPDGRVLLANRAWLETLGYSAAEIAAGTVCILDVIHPDQRATARARFARVLAGEPQTDVAVVLLTRGGHPVHVEGNFSCQFDADGAPVATRAILRDVTHRRLAEAERDRAFDELRRAHERLQALDAEKDAFLGICSHDLRNPLADILMATTLLQDSPGDAAEVTEVAGLAHRAAEFMLALVNNLLDVTAIEAGQFPLQPVPLDLHPLAAQVVYRHQVRATAKGIVLHLAPRFAPTGPDALRVTADLHATLQILDNLVSNAVKFTPAGGTVNVNLERGGGDRVRVSVRDSGPGLSVADQGKVFGKFARLSARPTAGERSSGLGLSIVKRLAEAMHGRVWCESQPGVGATFRVELPGAVPDAVIPPRTAPGPV